MISGPESPSEVTLTMDVLLLLGSLVCMAGSLMFQGGKPGFETQTPAMSLLCSLRSQRLPVALAVSKFTKRNNVHTTVMVSVASDGRNGCVWGSFSVLTGTEGQKCLAGG